MSITPLEICAEISSMIHPCINELLDVWNHIGFSLKEKKNRGNEVTTYLKDVLDNMITEERNLLVKIKKSIDCYQMEISMLCGQLNILEDHTPHSVYLYETEKYLLNKLNKLKLLKKTRQESATVLQKEEQKLCDLFSENSYYVSKTMVPTEEDLEQLRKHISALNQKKEIRRNEYRENRLKVISLFGELEKVPDTSFERSLLDECHETHFDTDEIDGISDETIMLSEDNIAHLIFMHDELETQKSENVQIAKDLRNKLRSLTHRLQIDNSEFEYLLTDCVKPSTINELLKSVEIYEKKRKDSLILLVDNAYRELQNFWDKCFISIDIQNAFFKRTGRDLAEGEKTDEILTMIEDELVKMQQYYDDNSKLLKLVLRRNHLWEQQCEIINNQSDPNRFFNRNCNLLKESKERSKVHIQLNKVQKELILSINEWEKENGIQFKVNNQPFLEYCQEQEMDEVNKKNIEKIERAKARTKVNQQESFFGSKPGMKAAIKRKVLAPLSMMKTPTKKHEQSTMYMQTPVSARRTHNQYTGSPLDRSSIKVRPTPKKYNIYSNVTSSGYGVTMNNTTLIQQQQQHHSVNKQGGAACPRVLVKKAKIPMIGRRSISKRMRKSINMIHTRRKVIGL